MINTSKKDLVTVSAREAFLYWLKLGFISFGGPAGQIALMHAELVEKRRWISEQRFLHALNYCMLLPGPEATQLAVYIGWLMHKTRGGLMAGFLFIFPSFIMLCLLSWAYLSLGNNALVSGILFGIKPAIVTIVLAAAWRIGKRTLKSKVLKGIALVALVSISILNLPFPLIILATALIGIFAKTSCAPSPATQTTSNVLPDQQDSNLCSYLIGDETPTPRHALFSWTQLLCVLATGIASGFAVYVLLALLFGWHSLFTDLAWLFTKTALLCFGGAYAVLPYVYQAAVEHFHWLSAAQMMDGLALGETTPGPLIMIVAFVGFIGGWGKAVMGSDSMIMLACIGASVACFFTFLPSFIFILAGGPLVESTRNNLHLTAPLNAISAAVVGVIISLAIFFAKAVFLPDGQHPEMLALLLFFISCVAIFRFEWGTMRVLAICALIGACLKYYAHI
ncbi:chromate efflux transporter [Undibacterium sp. SXout7W]|uniref:chromate efflux transporter n=1 Tax=Undibacterium sp. SXout7W TaxID=3413049 RepID=UPI003BF1DAA5